MTLLAFFVFLFITSMVVTFWTMGSVPDTLIQYTLGAGGVEALALAIIKVTKILQNDKKENENSEDEF